MSRYQGDSYDEEFNNQSELWWANVERHLSGQAGQKVLRELRDALLALPEPVLISGRLADESGCVCTVGALAVHRGIPVEELAAMIPVDLWDEYEAELKTESLANRLGLKMVMSVTLAQTNDDVWGRTETPEARYERVLRWVESKIKPEAVVA